MHEPRAWDLSLAEIVEAHAARTPLAPAVVYGSECLGYQALNRRANRLAWHLQAIGAGPGTMVATFLDRSVDMIVAWLAIVKAGAAYVPLDPNYPRERLRFMLEDSRARAVVTTSRLRLLLPSGSNVVSLDEDAASIAIKPTANPNCDATGDWLAHMIYTSGSTGRPKGVCVPHRAVTRLVVDTDWFAFHASDRIAQTASASFDAASFEVWGALLNGACLIGAPRETIVSPADLEQFVRDQQISVLFLTTALFHVAAAANPGAFAGLRAVFSGGEAMSARRAREVLAAGGPGLLMNAYGPTENGIYSTVHVVREVPIDAAIVSIGQPVDGTDVILLDDQLEPVAPGEVGELCTGGEGLADGYWDRPDLTAARFVPHPFGARSGARLYRTGDRARQLPDGSYEFLARLDAQVKVRGHRIEPGEVDAVLLQHPAVAEALTIAREDRPGEKRLVAYIRPSGHARPDAAELRGFAADRLPAYMIPSAFVIIEAMPVTANGKIDRRALPPPSATRPTSRPYLAPRTEVEETLVALWGSLTGVADAGIDDDFFELGGHSLLAAQAIARVNDAFGTTLPISTIFECPTVASVAERLSAQRLDRPSLAPIARAPRGGPLPLSYSQELVWFLNELEPGNLAYNFQANIRFAGHLDVAALERTLGELVRRHEILRTAFVQVGDQPAQVIHDPMPIALETVDLRDRSSEARAREMDRLFREQFQTPFDLQRPPLVRWLLMRTADDEHELIHVEHHLVHDGWSFAVLLRDLKTLYQAFSRGEPSPLAEPAWQFADYTCWQRNMMESGALDAQIAFWRRYVAGAPAVLELPTDHPRPETLSFRGACERADVATDLYAAMRAFSKDERVTLFMTMAAAFQAVLWRHTGAEDMVIGTAMANRPRQEFEAVVGMFVNPVLMRTDLSGNPTFRELVQRVRATALEIYARQETPFGKLVEALQPERDPARNPLFQVLFSFHDAAVPELAFDQVTGTIVERQNGSAKFDLNIICIPRVEQRAGNGQTAEDVGLTVLWEYNADLFDQPTARRLFDEYQAVLCAAMVDPDVCLGALPFVPDSDRRRLLVQWNQNETSAGAAAETAAGAAAPDVLHAQVAAQARRMPEEVAVRAEGPEGGFAEGPEITYGELNRRANRLAHHLQRSGAGPDVLIGIAAEPSVEMIVAVLAVLKSGAAYVPLDPEEPERLAFVLGDASPALLIADAGVVSRLPPHTARIIPLDDDVQRYAGEPEDDPISAATAATLACVIHTSGATGDPKGVMLTHANVARLFTAAAGPFAIAATDVWAMSRSWASGASLWDMWGALLHGGVLIVPSRLTVRTPSAFHELVCREGVTVLSQTPTAFRQFSAAQSASDDRHRLRHVVLSGESIEAAMLAPWFKDARNGATCLTAAYGLVEATLHTICAPIERRHAARRAPIPSGRRLKDLRVYILDSRRQPVPIGVPGEIYVGGAGVARGYLNRPAETNDCFVEDPFCGVAGARMTKTGDRGRWLSDGTLECLGRQGCELEIRGFPVDPGDLASRLAEQPGVRDAVVAAQPDTAGEKHLVAYYVCDAEAAETGVTAETLRSGLTGTLPAYLMPSAYVRLDSMPVTPHGTLDRMALPVPAFDDAQPAYVAPRTELEAQIAEIWRQVLGVERVGARDYFFDLGGHSLKTIQIRSRLSQELGVDLPLRAAFEHPTVEQQAQLLASRTAGASAAPMPIPRLPDRPHYALSHAQRRLWFLHRLDPADAYYNRPLRVALRGRLDEAAFQRAFDRLVERHHALRTQFAVMDDEAVQVIVERFSVPIDVRNLSGASDVDRRLRSLLIEFESIPFALDTPPVRARLFRLNDEHHVFVIVLHHIAVDGWSTEVLLDDLASLYASEMRSEVRSEMRPESRGVEQAGLPPLPVRGVDVAAWQQSLSGDPSQQEDEAYWLRQLAGDLPHFELPSEPSAERDLQSTTHVEVIECSLAETAWLEDHARNHDVTAFMLRTAILQAFLARFTGQTDVLIGVPVAGRSRPELERLVGFFANTLPLRSDLSGNPSFDEVLTRVRQTALDAYAHEAYPFDLLIERLNPVRDADRLPLLQVLFTIEPDLYARSVEGLTLETLPDLALEVAMAGGAAARMGKIDLSVSCLEKAGGRLAWAFLADGRRISKSAAGRLAVAFQTFLRAIVAQPSGRLADLPVLPAADRRLVLEEWNSTAAPLPSVCIHELVEAQARRTPDALAVACGDARLTYAELDRRANWMAHRLRDLGVGPDSIVGLYLERTPDLLIAMLATFKAGGAYLPLDPKYPRARLEWMLNDASVSVALTDRALRDRMPSLPGVQVLALDAVWRDASATADDPPASGVTPRNLAYVIYTSGSTGTPKGVAIEHASASAFVHQGRAMFTPAELAGVVASSSVCFDFSICEILVPLAWGGTVILIENVLHVPALSAAAAAGVPPPTMICAVPSALAELMRDHTLPATVRTVAFGGEALSPRLTRRAHEQPGVERVINVYGPTETTTFSTFSTVAPDAIADPPIGRPIANTRVYVLDRELEPVPPGAVGEIYIGGAGLSRGYHARPDLTAERFVPDPFGGAGSRLYRTGDRGRHLGDGTLEFVGRRDHQVKLRGYRIELGEIEDALRREGSVRDAVAIVREDVKGDPRLVAYVVPSRAATPPLGASASVSPSGSSSAGDATLARSLQRYLHAHLPSYMVPSAIVCLADVPRHPNGKVNRAALPVPAAADAAVRDEPRTDLEREIAAIWGEVLGVGMIGLDDNVYELGAHSLMATKVHRRIQDSLFARWVGSSGSANAPRAIVARMERQVRELVAETLPLRAVFDHPTVRTLAASIAGETEEPTDPSPSGRPTDPVAAPIDGTGVPAVAAAAAAGAASASYPASHAQRRMWLLHRLDPTGCAYNVLYPVRLAGPVDPDALLRAVRLLIERHETLRTTLSVEPDGSLTQHVQPAAELPWTTHDLSALPKAERAARLRERLLHAVREPFDLEAAPLFRAELLRLSDDDHRLLLSMHHVVIDGRSWEIIYADLADAYESLCAGRTPPAPGAGFRYVDYTAWHNDRVSQGQLAAAEEYWSARFADGFPELTLPVDHANPRARTFQRHRHAIVFDRETADRLRGIGRQLKVTPFVVHLSVLKAFLRRITGQDDLVIGTPVAGRDHPDVDHVVGCFINTMLLRTKVSGDPRFADLVETVKATAIDGYAHQEYPLDLLVQKIGSARDGNRMSLVQVLFATAELQTPRVAAGVEFSVPTASSIIDSEHDDIAVPQKFDVHAGAMDEPDGRLTWLLGFSTDLFEADTARRLTRQFESLVTDVAHRPEAALSALTLLTEAEHEAIRFRRAAGRTQYPTSFNQREMWVQCQVLQAGSGLNNFGIEIALSGPLDVDAFQDAYAAVVDRHESMRTFFDAPDGDPQQYIGAVSARAVVRDLSDRSPSEQAEYVRAKGVELVRTSFTLDRPPLFRAELLRLNESTSVFVFAVHHLILDAFHLPLFFDEIAKVYTRFAAGDRAPLLPLPLQYGDFASGEERMLAAGLLAHHQGHWQAQLRAPLPAMTLPIDRQPPVDRTFESDTVMRHLSPEVAAALKRLERRYRTTLFRAVAAAFEVWLWRMTGERDLLVAMPFSTRPNEFKDVLGFFGNTLPLRSTIDVEQPFHALLGDVTRRLRDARDRSAFPLTEAMRRLDLQRDPNRPVLPICISQIRQFAASAGDVEMKSGFPFSLSNTFDLWLVVGESRDGVKLEFIYAAELFVPSTIEAWADAFVALLASVGANPEAPVRDLGLVSSDHDALMRTWGDGGAGVPPEGSVGAELAAVAAARPDAIAVMAGTERLTYGDVQDAAGRMAASLQALGVGRDDRVGILGARSSGMLTTVIGVLQAGAAFVPLEASQPDSRLQTIALAARVSAVCCDRESYGRARALVAGITPPVPVTCWDDVASAPAHAKAQAHAPSQPAIVMNGPADLAYIFYTSGSTGTPKGVMVEQRGMRNHLRAKIATLDLDASSVVAQTASYGFDIVVWQWLAPLLAGGRVAIYDDTTAYDPAALLAALARDGVTVVETVPSFLEAMIAVDGAPAIPTLRWMVSNAEALPPSVAARWHARYPGTHLLNTYGATECSDDTTHGEIVAPVAADDIVRLDVGLPIPGSTAAVVDEMLRPVPPGCVGEVMLGGIAVGRGYLGDPVTTARAFVPDPYADTPGARMYRTGDRGRWRADGVLECLGRLDDQVKVHGYRVELGDVEAALAAIPELSQVAAAVRTDARGQRRLVAYYVGSDVCDEAAVRAALIARLPPYMVPSVFMRLAALPRTRTGKLNRAALPAPAAVEAARVTETAATPVETILAGVWQEVLKVPFVGRHDNFFDLGGDSIQSILVASRLTQRGLRMSPRAVFAHQTIAELARVVEQSARRAADDAAVAIAAPLLPIQQSFFAQALADPNHWNQAVMLTPSCGDDRVLRQAAQAVLDRHPALRMRFTESGGTWTQQPSPAGEAVAFDVVDLDASGETLDTAATRVQASLDIARGPVFRAALFRRTGTGDCLLLVVHHLVMDTVSWGVLIEDFGQAIDQASAGQQIHLIPESTTYAEWAASLSKTASRFDDELPYWQSIAARTRALPRDHDTGPNTTASVDRVAVSVAHDTTRRLLTGARRTLHADITHLLLCALARAVGGWTRDRTVTLYLEGHGREELVAGADLGRTIGWFTSAFPVALDTRAVDVSAHVARVGETMSQIPNRGVGYGFLRWGSGQLNGLPTPEISFNYHGQVDRLIASDHLTVTRESSGESTSGRNTRAVLVNVECRVVAGRLEIECLYSRHAHRPDTMASLIESFATELDKVAALCDDTLLPADAEDVYPLAPIQEGMLFHALYEPDSSLYYEQAHLGLEGPLDVALFRAAWSHVIATHPIMRSVVRWEGLQEPVQVVRAAPDAAVRFVDLRHLASQEQDTQLTRAAEDDWTERYSLDRGPLTRITLFALGDERFRFVWSFHHLLIDGWSVTVLLRDLARAYEALVASKPIPASPSRKYRDFVTWLRQQDRTEALEFWRRHLDGFELATSLPRDRPRPLARHRAAGQVETVLSPEVSRALDRWARAERVTMSAVLRAAWALLLSRLSGTADVVFGATVSGRPAEMGGIEQMVGPFINAVPVRVIVDGSQTVAGLVRRVHDESVAASAFEYLPLPELQKACGIAADKPLFDSLFAFENYPSAGRPSAMANVRMRGVGARELTHYDLTLIADASDVVRISLAYALDVFERDTAARMVDLLVNLLAAIVAAPQRLVSDVSFMPAADAALVSRWSDGGPGEAARDGNIAAEVAEIAARAPTAIAVARGDERWTYAYLSAASGRIAAELKASGVGREGRVGVLGTRSPGMTGTIIGLLHLGAAFVPIEPSQPDGRIRTIAQSAELEIIVTDRGAFQRVMRIAQGLTPAPRVLCWDDLVHSRIEPIPPIAAVGPASLTYILFTSGSTGTPKGVMVEQHGLRNHLRAKTAVLGLDSSCVVAQTASCGFDIMVWQVLAPLVAGGTVVIYDQGTAADGPALLAALGHDRVTVVEVVPSVLRDLLAAADAPDAPSLQAMRWVISNAEPLSPAVAARWLARYPDVPLMNCFGLTETSDDVAHVEIVPSLAASARVPVGSVIAGSIVAVVDEQLRPVPPGCVGEIVVGGPPVARGYIGDPVATARAFVPDPIGRTPGGRLYRTGDRGRWRGDGLLECLGRRDDQVKVHGHRVELGEVESALATLPELLQSAVAVRRDANGQARLVAYYVAPVMRETAAIRSALAGRLPAHMVPDAFVRLDALPLTPSGKLDRKALPAAPVDSGAGHADAPLSPLEATVATVWQHALQVPNVGRRDTFFDLGGHSLTAIRIAAMLKERLGRHVPIWQLFLTPTLEDFVEAIRTAPVVDAAPALTRVPDRAWYPVSSAQRAQWIVQQLAAGQAFQPPRVLQLEGALDREALGQALQALVDRHEVLRTTFEERDGDVVQIVHDAADAMVSYDDLSGLAPDERSAWMRTTLHADSRRPFVLSALPLFQIRLVALEPARHVLLFRLPHIISDGWTEGILIADLAELYNAQCAGRPSTLPALPLRYVDVCANEKTWLESSALQSQKMYWIDRFSGDLPVLKLPASQFAASSHAASHAAPSTRMGDEGRPVYATTLVDADTIAALRATAASQGATLFAALLSAFEILLARLGGQPDVVVGTTVAGRGRPELDRMAGLSANMLPLRTSLAGNPRFVEVLQRVSETTLAALSRQEYPYQLWIDELRRRRAQPDLRLFSAFFVVHEEAFSLTFDGLTARWFGSDAFGNTFDSRSLQWDQRQQIAFAANDTGRGWRIALLGSPSLFDEEALQHLLSQWVGIVRQAIADPERRLADIDLPVRDGATAFAVDSAVALERDELENLFA